jgi:transcriptional regulator with GAF, ATPase, and Fis domain
MSVKNEISVLSNSYIRLTSLRQEALLAPEGAMALVLDALKELVDYELAVVMRFDGDDTLRVHTSRGPLAGPRLAGFSLSLRQRPDLAALLNSGRPKLFSDDEDHLDTYEEILDLPQGHSCLAAPLIANGKLSGLLTLDNRSCGVFSPQILNFIGVISQLVALTLVQSEASDALRQTNARLLEERNRLLGSDSDILKNLLGESPAWREILDAVKLVAGTDSAVLLLGETGTGKEELARAIHRLSFRSEGPFVALNCSALPQSLAESELFGHEKGSFTGAHGLRKGRFELADGGTIFLDEIGDLPSEIQPKLLRALQEGSFERVGGEKAVSVNVRVIAATHVDLGQAVADGRFREDLFYRISVFPLRVPPLRERAEDVLLLAELFVSKLRDRPGFESLRFSAEGLRELLSRQWPGNVRELRNCVERAAILAQGGDIGSRELRFGDWACAGNPDDLNDDTISSCIADGDTAGNKKPAEPKLIQPLSVHLKEYLSLALQACGGKIYGVDGAAALLGIKPTTLQSKLRKLGL